MNLAIHLPQALVKYRNDTEFYEQLKTYYLIENHSKTDTANHFNLRYSDISILLRYFEINKPRKLISKISSEIIKQHNREKASLKINEQEFTDFYLNHSERETCEYFNLSYKEFMSYRRIFKIVKSQTQVLKSKRESTVRYCLQKYGVTNGGNCAEAWEKKRQTMQTKYGVDYYFQSSDFKNKAAQTKINKYGRANVGQFGTPEHAEAMIRKYGVSHPMKSPLLKLKQDQSLINHYGVNRYAKTSEFHRKARKKYIFGITTFDSTWELALWIYALDHNESIERCPCAFTYTYKNNFHEYFPDFRYKGTLIELKGDNWFDNEKMVCLNDRTLDDLYEAKHQCAIQNNVTIWKFADIKFAIDYCAYKYKSYDWYKQFIKPKKEDKEIE